MSTLMWAVVLILLALYIIAFFVIMDRFYRRWEAEYAETKSRKNQILQKRSLQQALCPYCGESIPPDSSGITNCPRCGRLVFTKKV